MPSPAPPLIPPQVRERDLPFVMHTLAAEFTILRVVNGETVAADDLGITNGFVKPKLGKEQPGLNPLGRWSSCCMGRGVRLTRARVGPRSPGAAGGA